MTAPLNGVAQGHPVGSTEDDIEAVPLRRPWRWISAFIVLILLAWFVVTIAPNPKKNTPVLVWEISERDEGNLDLYEGYPNYYRKEDLNIELLREEAEPEMVTAMVYIMENDFGRRAPSRYYYKVLHDGYKAFRFPMHILEGALKECMDKDAAQRMIEEVQA